MRPAEDDTTPVIRILIAEDEPELNQLIAQQLRQEGYEVIQAFDGGQALAQIERQQPDLAILDWMLPILDGIAVCRAIRERHVLPVIMLTARSAEADVILGLEVGADDYMVKPFRMRELVARVRANLRRHDLNGERGEPGANHGSYRRGPIALDGAAREVHVDALEVDLTPREFDLLALFMANPGRVFSRDYLLERVWAADSDVTDRTVDTHVQRLRKKLGPAAANLKTVWGIGYKLQSADTVQQ